MRILIADDQSQVRCALRCLVEAQFDLSWVGEAVNAADLLAHLPMLCPDVVLLDWELPGMRSRDLMRLIRHNCPDVKVIALSVSPDAYDEALQSGVEGFASKGDPPERLLAALRTVYAPI